MTPTNDAPVTVEQAIDAEVARIMAMSDDEIMREAEAGDAAWARGFKLGLAAGKSAALASAPAGDAFADAGKPIASAGDGVDAATRMMRDCADDLVSTASHHGQYAAIDQDKIDGLRDAVRDYDAALTRPRAAVGEREAIEALAPYAASVLSIIGAKSRRDNEKHITRADGTGITYGMLRAILALQSPPAKVEG